MQQKDRCMYEVDHTVLDVLIKDTQAPQDRKMSKGAQPQVFFHVDRATRFVTAVEIHYGQRDDTVSTSELF